MQYINNKNDNLEKMKFNLKIHSKDRNLKSQKNPFNFKISFNPYNYGDYGHNGRKVTDDIITYEPEEIKSDYFISSKYDNIKSIKINDIIVPTKIYTDYYGIKIPNVNLIKLATDKTARLFIDNDLVEYTLTTNTTNTITLVYHNSTFTISNVFEQKVVMINKKPYYINSIDTNGVITFDRSLPNNLEITDLYLAKHNKSNRIGISGVSYNIIDSNIAKIINKNDILYNETRAILITNIEDTTNTITFEDMYGSGISTPLYLMERNYIDVSEEKCFFLKIKEFNQEKETSSDMNINNSIGTFYVDKVSAESIVLVGNGKLTFNEKDLKNLSSLSFTLLNNRGEKVGNVYNDFSIHRIKDNFNNIILNIEITVLREKIN